MESITQQQSTVISEGLTIPFLVQPHSTFAHSNKFMVTKLSFFFFRRRMSSFATKKKYYITLFLLCLYWLIMALFSAVRFLFSLRLYLCTVSRMVSAMMIKKESEKRGKGAKFFFVMMKALQQKMCPQSFLPLSNQSFL